MIITIDGPAGTGKSTVAQRVARELSFDFLDTGAMYRAVGLAALRRGVDLNDARELAFVARHARIEFDWSQSPPSVLLNGEPVGHQLRGGEATRAASFVATVSAIRERLVAEQRRIGSQRKNMVSEGRDQGSIVFPDAELKFYLDAAPPERARRRAAQLRARGELVDMAALLADIVARDDRDKGRKVGALKVPVGAELIDTTGLEEDEVVGRIVSKAKALQTSPTSAESMSAHHASHRR
ncbi:MAG: (d)CMP kinase [Tepidisphaeraceae bacterium]|jgi:cytidylate kinase